MVTISPDLADSISLRNLGWSDFFEDQRQREDFAFDPCRIASVHRTRLTAISQTGPIQLTLPVHANAGDFAVGDWALVDPQTHVLHRRLTRNK
jgi:ribosome biogenesis GTPase